MQSPFTFLAEFLHPTCGSCFQFGMILVLPGAGNPFQSVDLLKAPKLLFCSLREESATVPLTH